MFVFFWNKLCKNPSVESIEAWAYCNQPWRPWNWPLGRRYIEVHFSLFTLHFSLFTGESNNEQGIFNEPCYIGLHFALRFASLHFWRELMNFTRESKNGHVHSLWSESDQRQDDCQAGLMRAMQHRLEEGRESARLKFFKSLMPRVDSLSEDQFLDFQIDVLADLKKQSQKKCHAEGSRPTTPASWLSASTICVAPCLPRAIHHMSSLWIVSVTVSPTSSHGQLLLTKICSLSNLLQ